MIIWLKALVEVLIHSVSSDITSAEFRASLTGIGTLKGFEKTLQQHIPYDEKTAHHVIYTALLDRSQIVTDILMIIGLSKSH